jgi:zinc protease
LGLAEILGGWKYEEDLPAMINNVTPNQINHAFNKYILGMRWCYLGDPKLADDAADAFKEPIN